MSCSQFRDSKGTRDECLTCGKTASEHGVELPPPRKVKKIKIWFGGKFWEYTNWEEARKDGFYLY